MTVTNRRKKRDTDKTFFLYVFFHSIWSSVFKIFEED